MTPLTNTDKTLWEKVGDYGIVVERVFVTEDGAIGICYWGECFIKRTKNWIKLALEEERSD